MSRILIGAFLEINLKNNSREMVCLCWREVVGYNVFMWIKVIIRGEKRIIYKNKEWGG